jgi:hypothetical protein
MIWECLLRIVKRAVVGEENVKPHVRNDSKDMSLALLSETLGCLPCVKPTPIPATFLLPMGNQPIATRSSDKDMSIIMKEE